MPYSPYYGHAVISDIDNFLRQKLVKLLIAYFLITVFTFQNAQ